MVLTLPLPLTSLTMTKATKGEPLKTSEVLEERAHFILYTHLPGLSLITHCTQ